MYLPQLLILYPALTIPLQTFKYKLSFLTKFVVFFCGLMAASVAVNAEEAQSNRLDLALAFELLKASKHDTVMTKREKLFVHRCKTVAKYIGFPETPLGEAMKYSCSAPVVGVAFYVGSDLGRHSPEKVAKYIEDTFAKNGVQAKVFIKHHDSGSVASYFVRGGREVMNPKDPYNAIKDIEGFVANMKLVYLVDKLITPEELEKWVKSETVYIPTISQINS